MKGIKESSIHYQVAQYLKHQYPNVIFRTDFAAGIRMTMGQAVRHKSLQSGRAFPDIFIVQHFPKEPVTLDGPYSAIAVTYCGLFIELKKDGTVLKRPKDARAILKGEAKLRLAGDWFDQHIDEQAQMLERLRNLGYKAEFAVGFDHAKKIIDEYLK